MSLLYLEYSKCSTCQKAKAFLRENFIDFTTRDLITETPSAVELEYWIEMSGLPVKRFFNTSGNLYKLMGLSKKLKYMTEWDQYDLLASDGMLIKRPLLIDYDFVLVGFNEEKWREKLEL